MGTISEGLVFGLPTAQVFLLEYFYQRFIRDSLHGLQMGCSANSVYGEILPVYVHDRNRGPDSNAHWF